MNKYVLLSTASVVVFNAMVQAHDNVGGVCQDNAQEASHYVKVLSNPKHRVTMVRSGESVSSELSQLVDSKSSRNIQNAASPDEKAAEGVSCAQINSNPNHKKLSDETIVDFVNFSYSAAKNSAAKKTWAVKDKELYNKLINDQWKLDVFDGTTGTAANQVESVAGLLAFKDDHIVIAARGTQFNNLQDWETNARLARRLDQMILGIFPGGPNNAEKDRAVTAQNFYGVDGKVAAGLLQAHLSYWNDIKQAILNHAKATGKSASDFQYTIVGHSQGGAKAQLISLGLLTDLDLEIGVKRLEKSVTISSADVADSDKPEMPDVVSSDIGDFHVYKPSVVPSVVSTDVGDFHAYSDDFTASGFYAIAKKEQKNNQGNVEAIAYGTPRVGNQDFANQANEIVGENNLVRVENRGMMGVDPFVHLAPAFLGYKHAGTRVQVNKGFMLGRHKMGNMGPAAIDNKVVENHRARVQEAKAEAKEQTKLAASQTSQQSKVDDSVAADNKTSGIWSNIKAGCAAVKEGVSSFFGKIGSFFSRS